MVEQYIPSAESLKFIAFIRSCGIEDNISPVVHYKLADAMFSTDKQDRKVLIECTRGLGKSTLMEYLVLYIAALGELPGFGNVDFIAFLGDSQDGNVKNFTRNILTKIDNSAFLQSLITVQRKTDKELELVNTDGKELDIAGKGMNTNIRGIRYKGKRIDLLICDDVTTNEAMSSEVIQETININYFNSALPALHPTKHKVFYICTPISERDLATQLKNSGAYRVEHHPLCSKFPCEPSEYDSIWDDRFPYAFAEEMYNQFKQAGRAQAFYQEYLLQITDLSTLLVEEDDIQWFDVSAVTKNKENYNFYISTDFATSTKKSADYSAMAVWAINNNNDWMLVDGQCLRQTMQENLDDLFRYVQKWKPLSVGIESSGQQGGFLSILQEMMVQRNIWFTLAKKPGSKDPGIRPVKDKMHRFVTGVQPKFKQGKIWLPKPELLKNSNPKLFGAVEELVAELSRLTFAGGFSKLQHDDFCDTLNQLSEMETFAPTAGIYKEDEEEYGNSPYWGDDPFTEKDSDYGNSTIF